MSIAGFFLTVTISILIGFAFGFAFGQDFNLKLRKE